ncbi:3-oxoacyl-ACP reductase-like protein [Rhizobium leguminosarum]|uniref:3-oxoacyl-ACP reductase-like protein n=2 Tax=Rhizobium/Agrobacterium group TaxID=227290 RepID=A0AAE2MJG0_RHILE|nr:3-oxoacyl-ACP reductase-like protein [Rhizobium leguminosarum]MBB4528703.1 3-oxoacyl-ACP reductase-like protein [Rhizobium leguminosarum]MDF9821281.1 3-oxoacyl-ACP reductase-like protein [Rhizobium leguminosarum]
MFSFDGTGGSRMGIFDKIKHAIFGEAKAAEPTAAGTPKTEPAQAPAAPSAAPSPTPAASAAQSKPATSTATVDIVPILDAAAKKSGQKLDWRHSIVDLMKAVGMDASLSERKELATELGYTGDSGDSAKMNMWLHKALMKRLSENGGKVPADLLD